MNERAQHQSLLNRETDDDDNNDNNVEDGRANIV